MQERYREVTQLCFTGRCPSWIWDRDVVGEPPPWLSPSSQLFSWRGAGDRRSLPQPPRSVF